MKNIFAAILATPIVFLAACASSAPPKLYSLETPKNGMAAESFDRIIGLSEVELPSYARNLQITTSTAPGELEEDDDHRWASPLPEMVTSSLARHIEIASGETVVVRPLPSRVRADINIQVRVDELWRDNQGGAKLNGQYVIIASTDDAKIGRFEISIPGRTKDYSSYTRAMNAAIKELAEEIGNKLTPFTVE